MFRPLVLAACAVASFAATQPETIDLRVEKKQLLTLIERIAKQCDAGLSVHHAVQDRLAATVTIDARDARWADAVDLLRQQYRLSLRLAGDRLEVGDADAALRRELVSVVYDVRQLTQVKMGRPGPVLSIPVPGGMGCQLLPPIDGEGGPEALSFIELIRERVSPASWSETAGAGIDEYNGALVIMQTPAVHRQITALLQQLEVGLARQVQVRVWRLPAEAAGGPAIFDRAACATRIKDLGAPALILVTGDDQQNHAWAGTQRNAILDLDVVQSRMDPIVTTLAAGLVLDVQPLITRAGLLLTIRFDAVAPSPTAQLPVLDGSGRSIAALDQPAQEQDSVRCNVVVPDGGAAVLRFGDRAYAIQAEVYSSPPPAP